MTQSQQILFTVLAAIAGAAILSALAMFLHTNQEMNRANPDRPRMTVKEFIRGIKF